MDEALELLEAVQKSLIPPLDRRLHAPAASSYIVARNTPGEGNGYRLLVDDKLIFDTWKYATALPDHATLNLSAGPHKIVARPTRSFPVGGHLRIGIIDQHKIVSAAAKALAAKVDSVIVAAGFDANSESEGSDRTSVSLGQEELIRELARSQ